MRGLQVSEQARNSDFLLAAINDAEGTIRATDAKAAVALVVHGLIFGALVGVTQTIGDVYDAAPCSFQLAVVALVAVTALALLVSVLWMLLCVAPAPRSAIPPTESSTGHFFVPLEARGWLDPKVGAYPDGFADSVASMAEADRRDQLTGELLKLSAIRARKIILIRRGLVALAIEFGAGLGYLALLALHQA